MSHHIVLLLVLALFSISSLHFITSITPSLDVFAQDEQGNGLVRCTAGNLVRSQSECPSTDLCPPPPSSPSAVANCTRNEPAKLTSREPLNMTDREKVAISTDKPIYKMGEIVNITVTNTGTDPLTFPDSNLGLAVENSITHEKFPLYAAQVITTLDSGGSKLLNWNQIGAFGQQVGEGNYTAFTSTGSLTAKYHFLGCKVGHLT